MLTTNGVPHAYDWNHEEQEGGGSTRLTARLGRRMVYVEASNG